MSLWVALNVVACRRYWLCAAAGSKIKIWDLESKAVVDELKPETAGKVPNVLSLAW